MDNLVLVNVIKRICEASLVVGVVATAQAELVFQHPSFEPGDRYRLIFVTSETRDATSTDIADYNQFVQDAADAAPIVGDWGLEWRVFGSTEAIDARDNVGTNVLAGDEIVPIVGVNGSVFAAGRLCTDNGSCPFGIGAAPGFLATPTELSGLVLNAREGVVSEADIVPVWTGTNANGEKHARRFLGAPTVSVGDSRGFSSTLTLDLSGIRNSETFHFYAVSEIITAVPEPSAGTLLGIGILALLWVQRIPRS